MTGAAAGASPEPKTPPGDGAETKSPLEISAEHLDVDVEAKTAVATGHVKLTKGKMTLSCPRVDVRYDHVPVVTWVKGSGGVTAEVRGVKALAPEVELDVGAQTLELRGGVRLVRGDGWLTAEKATIDIATGKVSLSDVKGVLPIDAKPQPSPKSSGPGDNHPR